MFKSVFVALLFLASSTCFADESNSSNPYLTLSVGKSHLNNVASIGVGLDIDPSIIMEADYRDFSNLHESTTPTISDPTYDPITQTCAAVCNTTTGTSQSKSAGIGLSALLKNTDNKTHFKYIRVGVLYVKNQYSSAYPAQAIAQPLNASDNRFEPILGFGVSSGHFSFEVTGYPEIYYYARSFISASVFYKIY